MMMQPRCLSLSRLSRVWSYHSLTALRRDSDEALSESRRKAVNEWYDHTLLSRLNDKQRGCIIIIMQRLHQDDLVGHVLEQEDWQVLSFAAIAEEDESHQIDSPLGRRLFKREVGEVLHPEREAAATLEHIRQTIGEYNFSAQYQQNPTPLGGAMVKTGWLQYYEPSERPERFSQTVQSWDTANKATELSDYSVCTTWGAREKRYYLLDVFRQRLNYPDLKRKVQELAKRDRPNKILIEDRASGTQLIQDLKADGVYAVTTQALDHLQANNNRVVLITPEMLAQARIPRRRPSRLY